MGGLLAARNKKSMILEFGKSTNCSVHWESCRNASSDSNRSVTNWKNPSAKYSQKYFQTDWKSIPMFLSEFQSLQLLLLGRLFSGFHTKDYSKIDYCKLKLSIGPKRNIQNGFFNLIFFGTWVRLCYHNLTFHDGDLIQGVLSPENVSSGFSWICVFAFTTFWSLFYITMKNIWYMKNIYFLGAWVWPLAMLSLFDIPWWWSNSGSAVTRECLKWILLNLWICFHYILIPT